MPPYSSPASRMPPLVTMTGSYCVTLRIRGDDAVEGVGVGEGEGKLPAESGGHDRGGAPELSAAQAVG